MRNEYYKNMDGFIFMYSIISKETYVKLSDIYDEVKVYVPHYFNYFILLFVISCFLIFYFIKY